MSENELREKLKQLIEKYGTTRQFIASNIGVNRTTICLFLKNERNLHKSLQIKLEKFLEERI